MAEERVSECVIFKDRLNGRLKSVSLLKCFWTGVCVFVCLGVWVSECLFKTGYLQKPISRKKIKQKKERERELVLSSRYQSVVQPKKNEINTAITGIPV